MSVLPITKVTSLLGLIINVLRDRVVEARQPHKLKVVGSSPTPATAE